MISLKRHILPRAAVFGFGTVIEEWTNENKQLFLQGDPTLVNLLKQCATKLDSYPSEHRQVLCTHLNHQYANQDISELQQQNLNRLTNNNTVTITTGHQLSLGLGPLFLLYKALHVISLCEQLNKAQTDVHVVPMFWLASEDHDFEEIKSTQFFHKDFTWETNQTGPVGRFETLGLQDTYDAMLALFQGTVKEELSTLFCVREHTYVEHVKTLLNKLLGEYGLLIIDGDHSELKRLFTPVIEKELAHQFLQEQVTQTNLALQDAGLKIQAHVRPINLFYLSEGKRSRIIPSNQGYLIDDIEWTRDALMDELKSFPERFSPNVLLRPIYQETILPNICYVGGSGELAYWAQLKSSFSAAHVVYPLIQTRISAMITPDQIDDSSLPLYVQDLSGQIETLLAKQSNRDSIFNELDQEVERLKLRMSEGISSFGNEAKKWCGAQQASIDSSINHYKQRWQKEEKQQLDSQIKRLERIHRELYPNKVPQERHMNLLHFCGKVGIHAWISSLKQQIEPFSQDIHIFVKAHETE
ncbi:MAG: bacillithiol biosynthesis cysteine-adding enzyme BshC [Flavobacteriales bacterium]